MILFVLAGAVWFLWRRSKSNNATPRDWLTVASLYTTRPLAALAPVMGVGAALLAANVMLGRRRGPVAVLAALRGALRTGTRRPCSGCRLVAAAVGGAAVCAGGGGGAMPGRQPVAALPVPDAEDNRAARGRHRPT